MVQVADMDFFRTYGLLWSREREDDLKEFITAGNQGQDHRPEAPLKR